LSAVRAMKPFWSAVLECYHWIEEPFLRKYQDWHDDDGGLFAGHYEDDTIGETDQSAIMQ
jgi:hypothetical protein